MLVYKDLPSSQFLKSTKQGFPTPNAILDKVEQKAGIAAPLF